MLSLTTITSSIVTTSPKQQSTLSPVVVNTQPTLIMTSELQQLQTQIEILRARMELNELQGNAPASNGNLPWEYKNIRFDFLGRGITQEFNILDVDGERKKGWFVGGLSVTTLPEMMNALGGEGWELVSHVVNQDNQTNNVTLHYMSFKRPGKVSVSNTFYDKLSGSADGDRGNRSNLPLIA